MPPEEMKPAAPATPAAPDTAPDTDFWGEFEKEDAEAAALYQKSLAAYEANPEEVRERMKFAMETPLERLRGLEGEPSKAAPKPEGNGEPESPKSTPDLQAGLAEALGGREVVDALAKVGRSHLQAQADAQIQGSRSEILKLGGEALKKKGGIFEVDAIRDIASEMVVSRVVGGKAFDAAVEEAASDYVAKMNAAADRIEIAKGEEGNRLSVTGSSVPLAPPNADFKKMTERQSISWMEQALAAARRGVRL